MCRKTVFLVCVAFVLTFAGGAFAVCSESILGGNTVTVGAGETWTVNCPERFYIGSQDSGAGHLVVDGGTVNITTAERFCVEYSSDITLNEGEITVTANGEGWYFPDDSGSGTGPRIFVNGGVFTMNNSAFEADCGRDGHVYVGCGTFRCKTDLRNECGGAIHAASGYEPLVYSSEGGYHVFTGSNCMTKVGFAAAASADYETVSPAVIEVNLSGESEETVSVDYAVTGGTATGGVDYTLANGTLTFSPGEISKSINIGIVNDGLEEDDETIVLTLSNPVNVLLGDVAQHTYTIIDPSPKVEFETASGSGPEGVQIIHRPRKIVVLLNAPTPPAQTVTADYAVTGGSATRGSDYSVAEGTLSFAPGEAAKDINLTVIDDDSQEGDETVVLTLSNPTGAKLGANAQHTYTIVDDDTGEEPPSRDFNQDGVVDFGDLIILIESWLECTLQPPELCWQ